MQSREETVHNRIASSESQLHDFNNNYKTEKETLELWVGDLSRQLMDEREKRKKLESDIEILKVQVTALTKYVQSCQSS